MGGGLRGGGGELPAGGIRASQGTFSSLNTNHQTISADFNFRFQYQNTEKSLEIS